jgi:hypothetical protein
MKIRKFDTVHLENLCKKLFDNFRLDRLKVNCIKWADLKLSKCGWVDLKAVSWIAYSNKKN